MNITLIKLPTLLAPKSLSYHAAVPPLGLAYIAGILLKKGHDVHVIDAVGESPQKFSKYTDNLLLQGLNIREIIEKIPSETEVIGITSMFLHEYDLLKELFQQIDPKIITIAGGENVTSLWDKMLNEFQGLDYCILGEGESKLIDLLHCIEKQIPIDSLEGVSYLKEGKPHKNKLGKRILNIDEIPWPAWDKFPIENYMFHHMSSGIDRGRSIPMLTSRGCPYSCKFCSSPDMWTTKYVSRSPKDVVDEIELYKSKYNIKNVDFHDLTAVLTTKWIKEFCDEIIKRNIQITWQLPQGTRSEVINDETAKLLYLTGCRNFGFSPESASEKLIKASKKNLKVGSIFEAMQIAKKNKIHIHSSFIVGLPGENWQDVIQTYKFIIKCAIYGLDSIAVMNFTPYPGSAYYNELVLKNKIEFDNNYIYSSLFRASTKTKSYNENFASWQITIVRYIFLFTFFGLLYLTHPWRVFKHFHNVYYNKQEYIMDQFIRTKTYQLKKYIHSFRQSSDSLSSDPKKHF